MGSIGLLLLLLVVVVLLLLLLLLLHSQMPLVSRMLAARNEGQDASLNQKHDLRQPMGLPYFATECWRARSVKSTTQRSAGVSYQKKQLLGSINMCNSCGVEDVVV
jgi:hypothetical protein